MSTTPAANSLAQAHLRHAGHYTAIAIVADTLYERGESRDRDSLQEIEAEWDNITFAQSWCVGMMNLMEEAAHLVVGLIAGVNDYLTSRGRVDIQKRWIDDGLRAARVLQNSNYECDMLTRLGNYYQYRGSIGKAFEIAQRAVALADGLPSLERRAFCYNNLASSYLALHRLQEAEEMYQRSLKLAGGHDEWKSVKDSHHGLCTVYRMLGNSELELHHNGFALAGARKFGARRHELAVLHDRGVWYQNNGRPAEARRIVTEALKLARTFSDLRGEILSIHLIGCIDNSVGQAAAAIQQFDHCLRLLENYGAPQLEALILVNKAAALERLRKFSEAAACAERSLQLRRAEGDSRGEANSLNSWGSVLQSAGRLVEARSKFLEARTHAEQSDSKPELGRSLLNLGASTGALGDPVGAIELLREALVNFQNSDDAAGQIQALLNLVQANQELRILSNAKAYLELALPLLEQTGDPRVGLARAMWEQWSHVNTPDNSKDLPRGQE